MKQTSSTRKLNEEARSRIASILLTEISDPRLSLVTVTGCEVSVDRSLCKVYVSTDKSRYEQVAKGLERAKGRIRYLLGQGLGWRVTPELVFVIDTSVDEAERITQALKNVPATMSIPKDEDGNPIA
ncbi:MAG: 30S ribosome-binding factor RbfA [Coriobacteriales bacterium]|nr:30S ribosome-binding factor RbfA [Coriobacteriales bacterium]MBQ6585421.1 30S ribosome-binding factor RbfA [Coriobacteriales bacterium]